MSLSSPNELNVLEYMCGIEGKQTTKCAAPLPLNLGEAERGYQICHAFKYTYRKCIVTGPLNGIVLYSTIALLTMGL